MKKFYALLLALDLVAIGTSATIFAKDDGHEDVATASNVPALVTKNVQINEEQMLEVLNLALQNPKIRKQLKKQVALVEQMPAAERAMYEKQMQLLVLQTQALAVKTAEGIDKILNPKKKEESFIMDVATGSWKIVKGGVKTGLEFALAYTMLGYLAIHGMAKLPWIVEDIILNSGSKIFSSWSQFAQAHNVAGPTASAAFEYATNATGAGLATAAGYFATNCTDPLSWLISFGHCAAPVVVNATVGI